MSRVAKAAVGLIIATIIGKILGFGRELVLASAYGVSTYSDAYLIAANIPLVIFASIGGALATTFIPMYFNIHSSLGEKRALKFTNNILNIVIGLCIVLTILGFAFTDSLVSIFAIGFTGETFQLTIGFTRILLMGLGFIGVGHILIAYLQLKNNFIISGLISVPKNVIIISSILLSTKYGPYIMVWGTLVGMGSEILFLLPFALKSGYKYKLHIDIQDENIKKMAWLIGPVFIGVAINQINVMIDRTLASTLIEGSISSLNYANKLNNFVIGLFIISITSVIYPMLSKLSSEENKETFIQTVTSSINSVIIMVIPISVGAIILAKPIVRILFQRGEFDDKATSMTAIALIMYSIGMVAVGLRDVLARVFYSLQDTKSPAINGSIAVATNIVLNLILIRFLAHGGLALATSISSIICIILLLSSLKKKIGYFGQDKILKTTVKSSMSAVIMGIITAFVYSLLINVLGFGLIFEGLSLITSIVVGALVYGILIIALKVEEVNIMIDMIKKKFKLKRSARSV